ncbi:MAG: PIN domain-containing protein [Thermodesulfobacteriota bacterium]|nr:PIN domain-containing protein [Thermodesulfobacteriota bacterium]
MIYLDTHVVVWLYAALTDKLSNKAIEAIETNQLLISPMVQLELQYLREIDRITANSVLIIETLSCNIGLKICDQSFIHTATEAIDLSWTRDPFDRLIVAQSHAQQIPLLTKDQNILKNSDLAFW